MLCGERLSDNDFDHQRLEKSGQDDFDHQRLENEWSGLTLTISDWRMSGQD